LRSGENVPAVNPVSSAVSLQEASTELLPDVSDAQVRERAVNE